MGNCFFKPNKANEDSRKELEDEKKKLQKKLAEEAVAKLNLMKTCAVEPVEQQTQQSTAEFDDNYLKNSTNIHPQKQSIPNNNVRVVKMHLKTNPALCPNEFQNNQRYVYILTGNYCFEQSYK
ncbi:hypothetical protein PVAND_000639 [Polypedilum vanderplanki]|uniref:Uncharacterized protein n=1 Tax=Polypedilum vanderplanki TaxID=319348 RepID=A0A9J6BKX0_POLVA|nr:hypothetical protein PVAND_000639 [Polypedilum vanderplanki]